MQVNRRLADACADFPFGAQTIDLGEHQHAQAGLCLRRTRYLRRACGSFGLALLGLDGTTQVTVAALVAVPKLRRKSACIRQGNARADRRAIARAIGRGVAVVVRCLRANELVHLQSAGTA